MGPDGGGHGTHLGLAEQGQQGRHTVLRKSFPPPLLAAQNYHHRLHLPYPAAHLRRGGCGQRIEAELGGGRQRGQLAAVGPEGDDTGQRGVGQHAVVELHGSRVLKQVAQGCGGWAREGEGEGAQWEWVRDGWGRVWLAGRWPHREEW